MGLFRCHKVNQGARIEGNGRTIDIVVSKVGGTRSRREADFDIRGVPGLTQLHLAWKDGLFELMSGVEIGIMNIVKTSGNKVYLHYRLSDNYTFTRIDYSNSA